MALYMVAYDICEDTRRKYENDIQSAMKRFNGLLHLQGSVFIIHTKSYDDVYIKDLIKPFLAGRDRLIVAPIASINSISGWMTNEERRWINNRLHADRH
ncbi:hypothetical protein GM609_06575 [Bombella sp. ESL0387]|nr:hypothetical protein [Bombella sp. ESL0387]